LDIRDNAVCDLVGSKSGYIDGLNQVTIDSNKDNINLTLTYSGVRYKIDGYIRDCSNPLENLRAKISYSYCGNETEGSLDCSNCTLIQTTYSDSAGYYEFNNVRKGFIKFEYSKNNYYNESECQFISQDLTFYPCLPPSIYNYWLRGIVLEEVVYDWGIGTQNIQATVKVYDLNNVLIQQMITTQSGRFAFYLQEATYYIEAETLDGRIDGVVAILNRDYNLDELEIVISAASGITPVERDQITEEFIDNLYNLVPTIIYLFLLLMLISAIKHAGS